LEALDNFLPYLGFALILLALLALFPPGGGLALAGTGMTALFSYSYGERTCSAV